MPLTTFAWRMLPLAHAFKKKLARCLSRRSSLRPGCKETSLGTRISPQTPKVNHVYIYMYVVDYMYTIYLPQGKLIQRLIQMLARINTSRKIWMDLATEEARTEWQKVETPFLRILKPKGRLLVPHPPPPPRPLARNLSQQGNNTKATVCQSRHASSNLHKSTNRPILLLPLTRYTAYRRNSTS